MYSKILADQGLVNFIAGSDYNLRAMTAGPQVKDQVDSILKTMGENPVQIYSCQQVHGDNIEYCSGENGRDFYYGRQFLQTDGLITDKKDIGLLIKFADCSPIILYDPKTKVQAALHSGWRGTQKKISQKAVEMMVADFACKKEDILAYIGPSIDMANYEVGPEVYEAFADFPSRDKFFKGQGEKYLMSMVEANYQLLLGAGIKAENIDKSSQSTYTNKGLNSARRDGQDYKLNAIITIMK
ncbi:MAG: peptidoglycan editing factor PgeF [Bacillota bacterium]|nr:peptidoglycan editing factor PgeF [Bacillota bacterium]